MISPKNPQIRSNNNVSITRSPSLVRQNVNPTTNNYTKKPPIPTITSTKSQGNFYQYLPVKRTQINITNVNTNNSKFLTRQNSPSLPLNQSFQKNTPKLIQQNQNVSSQRQKNEKDNKIQQNTPQKQRTVQSLQCSPIKNLNSPQYNNHQKSVQNSPNLKIVNPPIQTIQSIGKQINKLIGNQKNEFQNNKTIPQTLINQSMILNPTQPTIINRIPNNKENCTKYICFEDIVKIKERDDKIFSLLEKIEQLNNQISQIKSESQRNTGQEEFHEQIKRHAKQQDKTLQESQRLQREYIQELQEQTNQKMALLKQNEQLQINQDDLQQDILNYKTQVHQLQDQLKIMIENKKQSYDQDYVQDLQDQLTITEQGKNELKNSVGHLQNVLTQQQIESQQKERQIQERIHDLEFKEAELKKTVQNLQSSLTTEQYNKSQLEKKLNMQCRQLKESQVQVDQKIQDNLELCENLQNLNSKVSVGKLEDLEKQNQSLQKVIKSLKQDLDFERKQNQFYMKDTQLDKSIRSTTNSNYAKNTQNNSSNVAMNSAIKLMSQMKDQMDLINTIVIPKNNISENQLQQIKQNWVQEQDRQYQILEQSGNSEIFVKTIQIYQEFNNNINSVINNIYNSPQKQNNNNQVQELAKELQQVTKYTENIQKELRQVKDENISLKLKLDKTNQSMNSSQYSTNLNSGSQRSTSSGNYKNQYKYTNVSNDYIPQIGQYENNRKTVNNYQETVKVKNYHEKSSSLSMSSYKSPNVNREMSDSYYKGTSYQIQQKN